MRLRKIFPTPALLVLGFPLIWACEDSVVGPEDGLRDATTQLALQPRFSNLAIGQTIQLRLHFTGELSLEADGRDDEEWVSSDPSVAEVDEEGRVYALSPGKVLIEVYAGPFHSWAQVIVAGETTGDDPPPDGREHRRH